MDFLFKFKAGCSYVGHLTGIAMATDMCIRWLVFHATMTYTENGKRIKLVVNEMNAKPKNPSCIIASIVVVCCWWFSKTNY